MQTLPPNIRAGTLTADTLPMVRDFEKVIEKFFVNPFAVYFVNHESARHDAVVRLLWGDTEGAFPSHDFAIDEIASVDALNFW